MGRIENEKYLVVVSGPSGCGKDTVVKELMRIRPDISLSISCTSRPKRDYEVHGEHYYFITREEFEQRVSAGKMLEYTEYAGNYYGTPLTEIEEKLSRKETVILVIEVEGARRVKDMFPDSLLVFIVPPSLEELERRLKLRNTESVQEREKRLEIARRELRYLAEYDHVLENDEVSVCAAELDITIREWQETH